ncbi:hypothetical protein AVEN_255305-1 [Araneus ventricosus]|uniref:Uncharacterized protein n=1 Tax=Araneus ventricosus TaxID=182803 RepID=A0A4Y2BCJ2_ARAVE|nr:hypothetical protein AVEN_255305-1 [Araneus ventricosus]
MIKGGKATSFWIHLLGSIQVRWFAAGVGTVYTVFGIGEDLSEAVQIFVRNPLGLLGTHTGFAWDSPAQFGHQRGLSGAFGHRRGHTKAVMLISAGSQRGSTAQVLLF